MQESEDKETSTDKVKKEYKKIQKEIPVESRFSAPVQTGPGAHPSTYTKCTGFIYRGVKRPEHGVNHPTPCRAEVKERVELYLYFPSGHSCSVLG
jgi:hypothetical protein